MGPLLPYQLPPYPDLFVEKNFTQQEFGQILLQDTFINLPNATKLTITEANKVLCARGRIAESLRGKLRPVISALFGTALFPFTARIKITSKQPIIISFGEDETSYVVTTPAGFSVRRGYVSLSISMSLIQKALREGRIPDLPKLHTMQILWFRDLKHDFFNDFATLDNREQRKKINQAINAQMPSSHQFKLKYAEDETAFSPKMLGNTPDGVIVKSERVMSIRILPTNTNDKPSITLGSF